MGDSGDENGTLGDEREGYAVDFGASGDEVIALIKAGDTLTVVSVNVSCAETQ